LALNNDSGISFQEAEELLNEYFEMNDNFNLNPA